MCYTSTNQWFHELFLFVCYTSTNQWFHELFVFGAVLDLGVVLLLVVDI